MSDEVIQTPFGKFLIDPQDLIGSTLKAGTLWDGPGFLQPLAMEHGQLGTRGVTILDVGANIGSFSVWLAHHGAWRVVAVEPVPSTACYLKANLDLNQDSCGSVVIPVETAAYDRHTRMRLAAPLDPGNRGGAALIVDDRGGDIPAAPLDDLHLLWQGGVSFIKVDAQGCDGAVLYGLVDTLTQWHPTVVFEWEARLAASHTQSLSAVLTWLANLGYTTTPWPCYANNYLAVWRSPV